MHLARHSWALLKPEAVAVQQQPQLQRVAHSLATASRLRIRPSQQGLLLVLLPVDSRLPADLFSLQVKPQGGLMAALAAASRLLVRGLCLQVKLQGGLLALLGAGSSQPLRLQVKEQLRDDPSLLIISSSSTCCCRPFCWRAAPSWVCMLQRCLKALRRGPAALWQPLLCLL